MSRDNRSRSDRGDRGRDDSGSRDRHYSRPKQAHSGKPAGDAAELEQAALTGKIKRLVMDRGFGFILGDNGREYFFHKSSCSMEFESLRENERVKFDGMKSAKGPRAHEIRDEFTEVEGSAATDSLA